jgi:two-component system, chemotaxis family, chemotaxis protein CheY
VRSPHAEDRSLIGRESLGSSKVLVVDDSKLMHRMYEVMLRDYAVVYALDGQEGLDRLRAEGDVDLVLLDINMPRMNGLEFLAAAKQDPELAHVPVVIISTEGREEDTARGLEAGAAAYITKPFRSEEIRAVIDRLGVEPG